jgi:hypothetical protein
MRRWLWWGLLALGFFLLGIMLVWLWPRAAKWGLLPVWPSKSPSTSQVQPTQATVVSWQPEMATLTYTAANENQSLTIHPLQPMVALTQG